MTTSAAMNPGVAMNHLTLDVVLPWHENDEQFEYFKKLAKIIIIPLMLFLVIMPLLPDFTKPPEVMKKVITQLALDPPEVIRVPDEPAVEIPPVAKPKVKKVKAKKDAKPKPKTASSKKASLAALSKQLSALSSSADMPKLKKKNVFVADKGKVQKSSRSLLGQKNANSTSTGLKASDITMNTKGQQVLEHHSGEVESPIVAIELPTEEQYNFDPTLESRRDMQSIRRTLERYKGSVYALYTKELRKSPELNGRFIFEFVILPNGEISNLKLVSSELNAANLETKMLSKIGGINFGAADHIPTAVQYTFSFLPS
ncbi:MAG: AgmX/PglI C-terminal domain-containing protein [Oleispira sp.]